MTLMELKRLKPADFLHKQVRRFQVTQVGIKLNQLHAGVDKNETRFYFPPSAFLSTLVCVHSMVSTTFSMCTVHSWVENTSKMNHPA